MQQRGGQHICALCKHIRRWLEGASTLLLADARVPAVRTRLTLRMSQTSTLPSLRPPAASAPSSCTARHSRPGPAPLLSSQQHAASRAAKLRLLAGLWGRRRSQRHAAARLVRPPLPPALTQLLRPDSRASGLRCSGCRQDTALPRPVPHVHEQTRRAICESECSTGERVPAECAGVQPAPKRRNTFIQLRRPPTC